MISYLKHNFIAHNCLTDSDPGKYDSLWTVWEKLSLNNDYLNDSTPLEIEKILAKVKNSLNIDVFFSIGYDDDPRNSSSHSLLTINQIGESDKFHKR